jgi:hypothetical protein
VQDNELRLSSIGDRIEGFRVGLSATGGQRTSALSQPISSNSVQVQAVGIKLGTLVGDIALYGARTLVDGAATGDGNVVRFNMRQAEGSGARDNAYAHSASPSMTNLGSGNRVEVAGDPTAFAHTNVNIVPAPSAAFFANWQ